jgi:asparagine N-glycosylation enzyme membrane subunit Stt3
MIAIGNRPLRNAVLFVATVGVLVVGTGARLVTWDSVFTHRGTRFVADTDTHYHVLRAERLLDAAGDPWFDPALNHPTGAVIPWPPGFDALIAGLAAVAAHGRELDRATLEHVAVWIPIALALLTLALQLAIGVRWLGWWPSILATLFAAVLPIEVDFGVLGRPDQHVMELLVFCTLLLAVEGVSRPGRQSVPFIGILAGALAVAPWIWHGATLYILFVAIFAFGVYVLRPFGDETERRVVRGVAWAAAAAGLLLGASMLAWGPPPEHGLATLNGLSVVHPLSMLAVAAVGLALDRLAPRWPVPTMRARALQVILASIVPVIGLVLLAAGPIRHGLASFRHSDAWLSSIREFQPLFFGLRSSFERDVVNAFRGIGPALIVAGGERAHPTALVETSSGPACCPIATSFRSRSVRLPDYSHVPVPSVPCAASAARGERIRVGSRGTGCSRAREARAPITAGRRGQRGVRAAGIYAGAHVLAIGCG